jgi:endonuclease/exonuclease/phosphatase family metal-dependent hydrolase
MNHERFTRTKTWPATVLLMALACGPEVAEHADLPVECPYPEDRVAIRWYQVDDIEEREKLRRWCAAVGSPVIDVPDRPAPRAPIDSLAVVSWNTHVGGGALGYFVRQLRTGVLTKGEPVPHFVVLLQETFRAGPQVPHHPPAGASYAEEIFPSRELGERRDVQTIADEHGLYLYYVPSMRNGADTEPPEDRGNAILSTLPLAEHAAWELPFRTQRRVAIGAAVEGVTTAGETWRLSMVNVHLDLRTGVRTFFRSFGHVRERQMEFVMENTPADGAAIIGGDFNTWLGEREEPAVRLVREQYTEPRLIPSHGTLEFGAILERQTDYLFFRLPLGWSGRYRRIDDTYGSDHYPLLGWVRFGAPRPSSGPDGATDTEG